MKKTLLTALCSIFVLFAVQIGLAQSFSLGAKIGLNYSQLKMDNLTASVGTITTTFQQNTQFSTGFLVGGFAKIKFSSFYIQPELYFSMKGGSFDKIKAQGGVSGTTFSPTETYDVQTTGFDVPVLLGYQVGFFRVNLGPVASFNMSSLDGFKTAIEVQGATPASNDAVKTAIWGYQVGIGADISKFTLDLRYEGNFSSLTSAGIGTTSTSFGTLSQKTALFQFSVGYKFM